MTDIFTPKGIRLLLITFVVSFFLGGITAIVGFAMIVDVLATK